MSRSLLLRPGASRDDLYLELRTDAKELARLRRVAGEWLRVAGARDDEVGELVLALNELAANAVEHAYGPHDGHFTVEGARTGTTVSMAVTDAGRWRERSRPSARGRGLSIARQLVDELEIDSTGGGDRGAIPPTFGGWDMTPLAEVQIQRDGTVVVARLSGEIDLSNVEPIRSALLDPVGQETDCLIIDLGATRYLDSTGVRMIFDVALLLHSHRQQLRLVVTDETIVRRVLVLTKLDQSVPFDPSVDAALAACE